MSKGKEAELEAIYRKIPDVHCKGLCGAFCGPLVMTRLERSRIAGVAGRACQAPSPDLQCNMLTPEGRCSVYDKRPTICRLWGAVRAMACPHGCKPDRWLTLREVIAIVNDVRRVGGPEVIGEDIRQIHAANPTGREATFRILQSQATEEGIKVPDTRLRLLD
jgi:Fe-S-cluster containining protein